MNWQAIRRDNAMASARKAKRERHTAERKAAVERMGGPIKLAEVQSATRRIVPPNGNRIRSMEIWTFRGRDWVIGFEGSCASLFVDWRMDGCDSRATPCPMTLSAQKWLTNLDS